MKYLIIAINPENESELYPVANFNCKFKARTYVALNSISFYINGGWELQIIN